MAPGLHLPHVSGDTWADVNSLFSYYNEVYFGRKLGGTTQSDASSNKNAPVLFRLVSVMLWGARTPRRLFALGLTTAHS